MSENLRINASRELFDAARSAASELLLLASLRFIWLISFPLAFYFVVSQAWSVAFVALGYGLRGVGQLLAQRLRRSLRARCLARSAAAALDKAEPFPEAKVDSAFWAAQMTEAAVIVDVPTIVSSAAALLAIASLSISRFGVGVVSAASVFFLAALALTTYLNRLRVGLLEAAVRHRHATAEILSASERDAGEIAGPAARLHYANQVSQAARAWCEAQDRSERARLLHHLLVACFGVGALLWLASTYGIDVFGTTQHARLTLRDASDLLLLGSAVPVAHMLTSHIDALLMGHAELSKLERPRGKTRRGDRRLSTAPHRLVISNLRYRYGDKLVLSIEQRELDLAAPLLVVGENGAGKTTLVAILAGILECREGSMELDGLDVRELSREDVAFVPQQPLAVLELSVAENAALVAPAGSPGELRELLTDLGFARSVTHPMRELSKGEQQRVAIARALLKRPKLLVLDEPDAWLDRSGRERLVSVLQRARNEMAMVIVTHRDEFKPLVGSVFELVACADAPRAQRDAKREVAAGNSSA